MPLYRDRGVVLRTWKLGEADRILVIFTEGHGRVRCVAKGVRKTKSRYGARLDPMSHIEVQLYEGRELDTITQVESIDLHAPLRLDVELMVRASAMLEAVDSSMPEREPNHAVYRMLVGALRTLAETGSQVVLGAFTWKLLSLEGMAPQLDVCVTCGATDELRALDVIAGGAVCPSHRGGAEPMSHDALAAIQRILGGGLAGIIADPPPRIVVADVEHLATRWLESHLERRLRSVHVLGGT